MQVECGVGAGLPNNIETGSIEMPRLDRGLIVLEDNFNVVMKSCWNDRGAKLCGSARSWCVLDGIQIEDAGNVKPVGKLQWGGRVRIGDPINSIPELVVYLCRWIGQYNCPHNFYCTVVEWSLRIRPGCICCQICSDGPRLFHRPVNVISGSNRQWERGWGVGTIIVKDCSGSENWLCEPSWSNDVIVLWWPVHGNYNSNWLTNMNVNRFIRFLQTVSSFYFNKCQRMALDPEVDWGCYAHIWYSEFVGLSWYNSPNIN